MEFVGNQINVKSVLATLTVAFFIGRIHLFNGTFPAGIALITVMVAVSTIYIYLVPVMAAAMLTFAGQGMDFYGDMMAMIFCGVFFLFFHRQRFTINQRTAVAVLAMLLFNLLYYGAGHILYLLSLKTVSYTHLDVYKRQVLSRITNDVDTLGMGLNQSITQIITSTATIIGVVVMMLSISPLMTLIALIILPVSAGLMSIVVKYSQKHFRTQQKYLGEINGQVEETFAGHLVIKAFNKEEETIETFNKTNDILYDSAWKSQFLSGLMHPLMMFVGNMGYAGVAISGGMLAIKGAIGIGDIQAFIQYVENFTEPIQQIAQVINQVQSMTAASERVFEFLNEEEEDQTVENPVQLTEPKGAVQFDHVHFGYDPDKIIINDFNADVKPGQKIAIVGPTGAGKTTIVKLLMRFYDVQSGSIKLDGYDIRQFNRHNLRDYFGMVLQDTWLFKGTIMENIRYGRLNATDEEVIAAAKAAHADHFIRTLPGGYDMELNEDASNVSQGQKQLLTIARACLLYTSQVLSMSMYCSSSSSGVKF